METIISHVIIPRRTLSGASPTTKTASRTKGQNSHFAPFGLISRFRVSIRLLVPFRVFVTHSLTIFLVLACFVPTIYAQVPDPETNAQSTGFGHWRHLNVQTTDEQIGTQNILSVGIYEDKYYDDIPYLVIGTDQDTKLFNGRDWYSLLNDKETITPHALFIASDGAIWIAHDYELTRFEYTAPVHSRAYTVTDFTIGNELPFGPITAIAEITQTDQIWLGTDSGSAAYYERGEWHTIDKSFLPSSVINDLAPDRAGGIWFATPEGAVHRRVDEDGNVKWRAPVNLTNVGESLGVEKPSNDVRAIAVDHAGNVWFGTPAGIYWRTPEEEWHYKKLLDNNIHDLVVDEDGWVWVGTDRGALWWDGYRWQRFWKDKPLLDDRVVDIAAGAGMVWFATPAGVSGWDKIGGASLSPPWTRIETVLAGGQEITISHEISLVDKRDLQIQFVGGSLMFPANKLQYTYYLQGETYQGKTVTTEPRRVDNLTGIGQAEYSKLDYGTHTFTLRIEDWNRQQATRTLPIKVMARPTLTMTQLMIGERVITDSFQVVNVTTATLRSAKYLSVTTIARDADTPDGITLQYAWLPQGPEAVGVMWQPVQDKRVPIEADKDYVLGIRAVDVDGNTSAMQQITFVVGAVTPQGVGIVGALMLFTAVAFLGVGFGLPYYAHRASRIPYRTALGLWRTPQELSLAISGEYATEQNWRVWEKIIRDYLLRTGEVPPTVTAIPPALRQWALTRYYREHGATEALTLRDDSLYLATAARTGQWLAHWERITEHLAKRGNIGKTARLASLVEPLAQTLGFQPAYPRAISRLYAVMLTAPNLRLNLPDEFPLLFVPPTAITPELATTLRNAAHALNIGTYFALVVPFESLGVADTNTRQAKSILRDSPYADDFIILSHADILSILAARDPMPLLIQYILAQADLVQLSPFVTKGAVPPKMFFGRDQEIRTLTQAIAGTNFALVGNRRVGKTSLLNRVVRILAKDPAYLPTSVDLQAVRDDAGLFEELAAELPLTPPSDGEARAFADLVTQLREQNPHRVPVFLFDEMDAYLAYDAARGYPMSAVWRKLGLAGACRFIFAGSRILAQELRTADSPFFNFPQQINLGFWEEDKARAVVTGPMSDLGIELVDEAALLSEIINLSSCHPSLVQYICAQLIAIINVKKTRHITREDLAEVRASGEFAAYYLDTLWGQTNPLESAITILGDPNGFTMPDAEAALQAHGFAVDRRAVKDALDMLVVFSLLRQRDKTYTFAPTAFPQILRETQEVDYLLVEAKSAIDKARSARFSALFGP